MFCAHKKGQTAVCIWFDRDNLNVLSLFECCKNDESKKKAKSKDQPNQETKGMGNNNENEMAVENMRKKRNQPESSEMNL